MQVLVRILENFWLQKCTFWNFFGLNSAHFGKFSLITHTADCQGYRKSCSHE